MEIKEIDYEFAEDERNWEKAKLLKNPLPLPVFEDPSFRTLSELFAPYRDVNHMKKLIEEDVDDVGLREAMLARLDGIKF